MVSGGIWKVVVFQIYTWLRQLFEKSTKSFPTIFDVYTAKGGGGGLSIKCESRYVTICVGNVSVPDHGSGLNQGSAAQNLNWGSSC